ncbi:MAG: hypothetical protein FD128_2320 [Hyphomonadaceae bacterium]|nr:MAG: hypothetical protein FD128_2320 [Hyphomonadaceae bacterium]
MKFNDYDVKLHKGGAIAWDASDAILTWLEANIKPGMKTLETGAGKTTMVFANCGASHQVITPSDSEIENIKNEAKRVGIDTSNVTFYNEFSQNILPKIAGHENLDVVLIDGGHGFPIPAVDWLYTAPMLKIGGKLLIDDVDLWTGKIWIPQTTRKIVNGLAMLLTLDFKQAWKKLSHEVALSKEAKD